LKYLPFFLILFFVSCELLETTKSDKEEDNPIEFSENLTGGKALEVQNNILAVSDFAEGIHFFDIEKRTSPDKKSTFLLESCKKTRISGNFAYALSGSYGSGITNNKITIVDIADINAPEYVSEISFEEEGYEIVVQGNYLFVAAGKSGLLIYNISDKNNPQEIANYQEDNSNFTISDLKVDGSRIYLADFFRGVIILDISSINKPIKIAEYIPTQQNNCSEIELYQGKVIMLDFWDKNYDILELDNENQLDSVATIDFERDYDTTPTELLVSENSLFASAWWQHALEYDLSDMDNVTIKNEWELPGHQKSIAVAGNYVYVLHEKGIEILSR